TPSALYSQSWDENPVAVRCAASEMLKPSNPDIEKLNTTRLPFAALPEPPIKPRAPAPVVIDEKSLPAFTLVPANPLSSLVTDQIDEPLVPSRLSVPDPKFASKDRGVLGCVATAVPPLEVV
ncbi:MAG: hypothetical protein ACO3RK_07115, partial [Luteolibacter sp.]